MTEKQIEKVKLLIKQHRAILAAEKRKFGGFDDSAGRRYYIADLYMRIADYKGTIVYKKWFNHNFPDDIGGPLLSLYWSVAYFELGKITDAKIYTIDTAFQNIYFHKLLLDREIIRFDMYNYGCDMLEFAKSMVKEIKKVSTKKYIEWLATFIETDEYKEPINKLIEINKLLKDENNTNKRSKLFNQIRDLEIMNKERK